MQPRPFNQIADTVRTTAEGLIPTTGQVPPPTLFALRGGRILAMIGLRPVYPGHDARMAIVEMSNFAAAADANAVVFVWEDQDLARACGEPLNQDVSVLQVCWADRREHRVTSYPFRAQVVAAPGSTRMAVDWLPAARDQPAVRLPQVIETAIHFCWKPFDTDGADYRAVAALMQHLGYQINLAA